MLGKRKLLPSLFGIVILFFVLPTLASVNRQQDSIDQLEIKLKSQHRTIEKTIYEPPRRTPYQTDADYRRKLREWQDDLAQTFAAAAETVQQILKLSPSKPEYWQEQLETLQLYSQPISSPDERKVYGAGEVQQSARFLDLPAPAYTDEARAAHAHGEVRLRLVLASDGTAKYIFPIKSLPYGLTESAMAAARQIKFEPAVRNGKPASEFITLVYEFKNGEARTPYIPRTIF
jgi:TonB family protein